MDVKIEDVLKILGELEVTRRVLLERIAQLEEESQDVKETE